MSSLMGIKQALLDICILDHLKREGLNQTTDIFQRESLVDEHIAEIDGYLSDWWGVFADTYFSRPHPRREEYPFPGGNVSNYSQDQQFVSQSLGHRSDITTLPAAHHPVNSRQIIDRVAQFGQNNAQIKPFLPGPSRYQGVKPPFINTTPREIPFTPLRNELPGLTHVTDGFPELPNILGGSNSHEIPDIDFTSIRAPRLDRSTSFLNDFQRMPETRKVTPQDISSLNSGSSSHESQEAISPIILPRGMPLTHFLDGFPEIPKTSDRQFGRPKVPSKVLRQDSRKRKVTGQLGLKQKSNEGGDFTEG